MNLRPADLKRIDNLHPDVRLLCLEHVQRIEDSGLHVYVTQTYRMRHEQEVIWAQGRNDMGQIIRPDLVVTHSPPGWSWHEYGLAYDLVLVLPDLRTVSWDVAADTDHDAVPDYLEMARLGRNLGLEAGMFWIHPDPGHYEFHPNLDIHEAIQKFGITRRIPDSYFWKQGMVGEVIA